MRVCSHSSIAPVLTSPMARSSRRRRATSCGVPSATSGSSGRARAASRRDLVVFPQARGEAVALRADARFAQFVLVDRVQRGLTGVVQRAQARAGLIRLLQQRLTRRALLRPAPLRRRPAPATAWRTSAMRCSGLGHQGVVLVLRLPGLLRLARLSARRCLPTSPRAARRERSRLPAFSADVASPMRAVVSSLFRPSRSAESA